MVLLVNDIPARKLSRREVGGPAQRLQVGVRQLTGKHSTPTLDFFRVISAGECLVVITVALCGAKPNSLTPLGSFVLPLLKITTLRTSLAALCNEGGIISYQVNALRLLRQSR
jgi:hypothetical protein